MLAKKISTNIKSLLLMYINIPLIGKFFCHACVLAKFLYGETNIITFTGILFF